MLDVTDDYYIVVEASGYSHVKSMIFQISFKTVFAVSGKFSLSFPGSFQCFSLAPSITHGLLVWSCFVDLCLVLILTCKST